MITDLNEDVELNELIANLPRASSSSSRQSSDNHERPPTRRERRLRSGVEDDDARLEQFYASLPLPSIENDAMLEQFYDSLPVTSIEDDSWLKEFYASLPSPTCPTPPRSTNTRPHNQLAAEQGLTNQELKFHQLYPYLPVPSPQPTSASTDKTRSRRKRQRSHRTEVLELNDHGPNLPTSLTGADPNISINVEDAPINSESLLGATGYLESEHDSVSKPPRPRHEYPPPNSGARVSSRPTRPGSYAWGQARQDALNTAENPAGGRFPSTLGLGHPSSRGPPPSLPPNYPIPPSPVGRGAVQAGLGHGRPSTWSETLLAPTPRRPPRPTSTSRYPSDLGLGNPPSGSAPSTSYDQTLIDTYAQMAATIARGGARGGAPGGARGRWPLHTGTNPKKSVSAQGSSSAIVTDPSSDSHRAPSDNRGSSERRPGSSRDRSQSQKSSRPSTKKQVSFQKGDSKINVPGRSRSRRRRANLKRPPSPEEYYPMSRLVLDHPDLLDPEPLPDLPIRHVNDPNNGSGHESDATAKQDDIPGYDPTRVPTPRPVAPVRASRRVRSLSAYADKQDDSMEELSGEILNWDDTDFDQLPENAQALLSILSIFTRRRRD